MNDSESFYFTEKNSRLSLKENKKNLELNLSANGRVDINFSGEINLSVNPSPCATGGISPQTGYFGEIFYTACEKMDSFKRSIFLCGMNMAYIIDEAIFEEDGKYKSDFHMENKDFSASLHISTTQRLVFRQKNSAMKLFNGFSQTDGKDDVSALLFENTDTSIEHIDRLNSSISFGWESEKTGRRHLRVHTLCLEERENIRSWHLWRLEDGFFQLESPDHEKRLDLGIFEKEFILRHNGEEYAFKRI